MCSFQGAAEVFRFRQALPPVSASVPDGLRLTVKQSFHTGMLTDIQSLFTLFSRSFLFRAFLFLFWQPPALPCRLRHSTIGRQGLNHRVRDGYGCVPLTHRHQKFLRIHV